MKTFKGYVQADYSPENWVILLNAKAAGDTNIDNATSVADVMAALNDAQAAMAAINTLLDDAKAAAHASLNAALAGYSQADYSPENWTILLNAMTTNGTGNAVSVADVTTALNNAQAAMAAVNTLLTDAKIAAHTNLNTALLVYTQADYSPDNWTVLNDFKTAGDTAIDAASDLAEVEAAQSAAATGMDGVQTIAQTLAAAKSAAHEALAAAFGTSQSNDPVDDSTALTEFEVTGDTEPDAVTEIDQAEESPAVDSLTLTTGTEVVDADTANDALIASQEISTANVAEEKLADLEPAQESITLDTTN